MCLQSQEGDIDHKLIQEGIKPDSEKASAIKDMPTPTDKSGAERLLGTVNYLGKFILNLASVTEPVRVASAKGHWISGLVGVLLQDNCPVAYASRSLTEAESRYAQIEKELLAVQFSPGRFNQYVYEKKVHVESDHKPLEIIVKKPLVTAPSTTTL